MILYHLSTNGTWHDGSFHPRIPNFILPGENNTIPRVCASDSIEGCLSSMPDGGANLVETIEAGAVFRVFVIDTEKLGIHAVLTPTELYEKKLVPDIECASEYWILEGFQAPSSDSFLIDIHGFRNREWPYFNHLFYEELQKRALSEDEFIEDDDFDEDFYTNYYVEVYDLDYSRINRG